MHDEMVDFPKFGHIHTYNLCTLSVAYMYVVMYNSSSFETLLEILSQSIAYITL